MFNVLCKTQQNVINIYLMPQTCLGFPKIFKQLKQVILYTHPSLAVETVATKLTTAFSLICKEPTTVRSNTKYEQNLLEQKVLKNP